MVWWFIIAGILGGIIGGMGMGGGTLLIPILTLGLNVGQKTAQLINLLTFIPMSVIALLIHARNKMINFKKVVYVVIPASVCAAISAFYASAAQPQFLQKLFGAFMILLAIVGLVTEFIKLGKN
ncbi:MAG: TSUP family transporter [Clostridiales bacterium]|nr:TSUP family transporter [Clostridiales bacterium]